MRTSLVFGSTGFLGETFFKKSSPNLSAVPRSQYDFTQPIPAQLHSLLERSSGTAGLILTAISSPDECLRDPVVSQAVNVTGTMDLLKEYKRHAIKPVFFSSDHVFDGIKGNYREADAYGPITLYGRQKMQTETFIRENFSDFLILRTSKQVAMRVDSRNTLSEMALLLKAAKPIRCATDNWIAPSFVEDIRHMTLNAVKLGLSGIFHVAPNEEYSRLELGHHIADCLGVTHELVHPCSILDFKFLEVRPPHCTLDGSHLRKTLDYKMTSLFDGLGQLKAILPIMSPPHAPK